MVVVVMMMMMMMMIIIIIITNMIQFVLNYTLTYARKLGNGG